MTPIEDLVREALAATPTPTASSDPFVGLDRRIRRARRRLTVGAGVAAAVVAAAVVVPLASLGGNGSPDKLKAQNPPTPSPSALPGTSVQWSSGAIWASTDSDGRRWMLFSDGSTDGSAFVGHVVPGGGIDSRTPVEAPADYVVAGDNVVWVIGGGDGGNNLSRLTAINIDTGAVATLPFHDRLLSYATAVGDSLYVDANSNSSDAAVDRVDVVHGAIRVTASRAVPMAEEIVSTEDGHVWVHAGNKLVWLSPTNDGLDVKTTVTWGTGEIFAAVAGPDGNRLWAYDGARLIDLTPESLAACVSCAEGERVPVEGRPTAVAQARVGGAGLFVANADADRIDYYSASSLGTGNTPVSATLSGVHVITMVADSAGGVDYVDDQGQLVHWAP